MCDEIKEKSEELFKNLKPIEPPNKSDQLSNDVQDQAVETEVPMEAADSVPMEAADSAAIQDVSLPEPQVSASPKTEDIPSQEPANVAEPTETLENVDEKNEKISNPSELSENTS